MKFKVYYETAYAYSPVAYTCTGRGQLKNALRKACENGANSTIRITNTETGEEWLNIDGLAKLRRQLFGRDISRLSGMSLYEAATIELECSDECRKWAKEYFGVLDDDRAKMLSGAIESYSNEIPRSFFDEKLRGMDTSRFYTMRALLGWIVTLGIEARAEQSQRDAETSAFPV